MKPKSTNTRGPLRSRASRLRRRTGIALAGLLLGTGVPIARGQSQPTSAPASASRPVSRLVSKLSPEEQLRIVHNKESEWIQYGKFFGKNPPDAGFIRQQFEKFVGEITSDWQKRHGAKDVNELLRKNPTLSHALVNRLMVTDYLNSPTSRRMMFLLRTQDFGLFAAAKTPTEEVAVFESLPKEIKSGLEEIIANEFRTNRKLADLERLRVEYEKSNRRAPWIALVGMAAAGYLGYAVRGLVGSRQKKAKQP